MRNPSTSYGAPSPALQECPVTGRTTTKCASVARSLKFAFTADVPTLYTTHKQGLLHVWEAELHDRWFSRASRELGVPLTAARGIAMTAHPDSCTRALCAGAGIQVRRQTGNALERGRYTGFANRLPGAGMAGAR